MDIAFDRTGTGEPLLLVHPLGANRGVWQPLLPHLASDRDVIAVDMPGFGDSPALGDRPTPRALAAALAGLLDRLEIPRVHVAGNSLGGWVALELDQIGRAESVTGLAPAGLWRGPLGPRRGPNLRPVAKLARPLLPLLMRSRRARRAALAPVVAHPDRVPRQDAVRLVSEYLRAPGFEAANAAMRADVFEPRATGTPISLAWPEHDRLVARPARLPQGWRSITLPGCGHIPMWDAPGLVARVILDQTAVTKEVTS